MAKQFSLRPLLEEYKLQKEERGLQLKAKEGILKQSEVDAFKRKVASHNAKVEKENKKARAAAKRRREGGCFISTAVMSALGEDDQCRELNVLRQFRDNFLLSSPDGEALVDEYYAASPKLLEKLNVRALDDPCIYSEMFHMFLAPAVRQVEGGDCVEAVITYKKMIAWLEQLQGAQDQALDD